MEMEVVALITFGCAKNLVDSEVMHGYLTQSGYQFTSLPEKADIIILNTCGFIKPARDEAERAIRKVESLKRKNSRIKIIVAGCYSERYRKNLEEKYPAIDTWLGVKDFDKIVQVIKSQSFQEAKGTYLYNHKTPRSISTPPSWAYIKISEGCSHECTFCSIPLIKGPYRSREISSIFEEAQNLASRGVKEINLISQDTTYFGRDQGLKDGLTLLLKNLLKIQGIEWVRILYGYPEEISDSLLEVMGEKKICSYLDIPFQHSDARIVKKMGRSLDGERALKLLKKIRQKIPEIALRTSLVVGFPGEGKREFESLIKFIQEARFDHLGVFTYSQEEGTNAFALGDAVKESVKARRKEKIMEIQADISHEIHKRYVGQKIEVLFEGRWKENPEIMIGRSQFQAPEVDGVIFLDNPKPRVLLSHPIQKVEILSSDVYDLHGKILG